MNRTEIGQGTLASTNRLLLRGFSCEFLGLFNRIVLYAIASMHTYIHPSIQIRKQTVHHTREQIK
jgi:hypothetical protein